MDLQMAKDGLVNQIVRAVVACRVVSCRVIQVKCVRLCMVFHSSQVAKCYCSVFSYITYSPVNFNNPSWVEVVRDWLYPESWKQLQRFLAFANFYWKFIRGCCSIPAPTHFLTAPLFVNSRLRGSSLLPLF